MGKSESALATASNPLTKEELSLIDAWWRASNCLVSRQQLMVQMKMPTVCIWH